MARDDVNQLDCLGTCDKAYQNANTGLFTYVESRRGVLSWSPSTCDRLNIAEKLDDDDKCANMKVIEVIIDVRDIKLAKYLCHADLLRRVSSRMPSEPSSQAGKQSRPRLWALGH